MEVYAGSPLTFSEYASLCKYYRLHEKCVSAGPMPPTHYAQILGRVSGELIGYLWFSQGEQRWVLFGADDVDSEWEELFWTD